MMKIAKLWIIIALVAVIGFGVVGCELGEKNEEKQKAYTAYSWYGNGSANSFTISNATQLLEFARIVSGTTGFSGPARSSFSGKTVTLSTDINLNTQTWTPIGSGGVVTYLFLGTFDGNSKTISNLYSTGGGLFGSIGEGGVIKNVTLTNISTPNIVFSRLNGETGINFSAQITSSTASNQKTLTINKFGVISVN